MQYPADKDAPCAVQSDKNCSISDSSCVISEAENLRLEGYIQIRE